MAAENLGVLRFPALAMLLLAAACVSPPRRDADAEVLAWVEGHYGDTLRGAPQIFYGDFTGDGAPDALAWVMYNDGGLHNFGEGSLFRGVRGRMVFWRTDETTLGEDPRDVRFAPGRIRLTTTVLQDGDARCCPTGKQRWTIDAH